MAEKDSCLCLKKLLLYLWKGVDYSFPTVPLTVAQTTGLTQKSKCGFNQKGESRLGQIKGDKYLGKMNLYRHLLGYSSP